MSVFDPNKDYTNDSQSNSNIYETVMEVQHLLQEITALLNMQDDPSCNFKQLKHQNEKEPIETANEQYEDEIVDDDQSTVYDDIFE